MPNAGDFQDVRSYDQQPQIANAGQVSNAVDIGGSVLVGLFLPAAFTGTSVTFQAATTLNGTYGTVQSGGADYTVNVTQGKYAAVDPTVFSGLRYIKVVSGSAEGGNRTITLATRAM
jgi:hypothetical protein